MSQEPAIHSTKLKGHQKAVLCLDHSSSLLSNNSSIGSSPVAGSLLSGSADGTARLWDLRANLRTSICIQALGDGGSSEVLSVAFGPQWDNESTDDTSSTEFSRNFLIYLATGNSVYGYDLRKANSPILKVPSIDLSFLGCLDEINQIAFSPPSFVLPRKGRGRNSTSSVARRPVLATADDAGAVRVTESIQCGAKPNCRVYPHGPNAMVTSLAFRPCVTKGMELASGGTDCQIHLWGVLKEKSRPMSSVTFTNTNAGANQVCNPPMVNSLQWSPSGRLLAAALGDGSIGILLAENRSLVTVSRLPDAHGGAVASVVFCEWGKKETDRAVTTHDRLMCSAGNDGAIVLWDLGVSLCGEKARPPAHLFWPNKDLESSIKDLELTEQPKALFAWEHGAKPNWMVSSRGLDPMFPSSLFVADTTNEISVYTIPTA